MLDALCINFVILRSINFLWYPAFVLTSLFVILNKLSVSFFKEPVYSHLAPIFLSFHLMVWKQTDTCASSCLPFEFCMIFWWTSIHMYICLQFEQMLIYLNFLFTLRILLSQCWIYIFLSLNLCRNWARRYTLRSRLLVMLVEQLVLFMQ